MTSETTTRTPRFRVALSFPGEKRDFVEKVASSLAFYLGRERVLYDMWPELQAEFARPDLGFYLPDLYKDDTELAVVFVCDAYDETQWCRLEWRQIHDHIFRGEPGRVMLLRVDSETATLPGLSESAGFNPVSTASDSAANIAVQILHRLGVRPDDQLSLFLDRVLHRDAMPTVIQHALGDRSVTPANGAEAVVLLHERRALTAGFFHGLRAQVDDQLPDIAPGVGLHAEIEALRLRQKLDPSAPPKPPTGTARGTPAASATVRSASHQPSHFSLVIDRTKQWRAFTGRCSQKTGDHVFVVHGRHDQDIHLFLERVRRFFDDVDEGAGLVAHELVVIDLEQGGARPTSVDAWHALVRQRINETTGGSSRNLPQALADLCRQNAAILVFVGQGGGGLLASPRPGLTPLDVVETGAFVDFVAGLPALFRGKPARKRPLRVVVPLEYADRRTDPLWLGLDPYFQPPHFQVLAELTYPDWSEIEDTLRSYMGRYFGRYNPLLLRLCEDVYHAHEVDPAGRTFAALGEALSALLATYNKLPETPPARGRR